MRTWLVSAWQRTAGKGAFRNGSDGKDLYIPVPVGTIIRRKGAEVLPFGATPLPRIHALPAAATPDAL